MCNECDEIQRKIDQYKRFLRQPLDLLTKERFDVTVAELEQAKSLMHPPQRSLCTKCQMRMIAVAGPRHERVYECLRCGHAETPKA